MQLLARHADVISRLAEERVVPLVPAVGEDHGRDQRLVASQECCKSDASLGSRG
jgi:hypothetical protein